MSAQFRVVATAVDAELFAWLDQRARRRGHRALSKEIRAAIHFWRHAHEAVESNGEAGH